MLIWSLYSLLCSDKLPTLNCHVISGPFSLPRLSCAQYRTKKSYGGGRPATATSTMTQSSLAAKLSSSQLLDPQGYSPPQPSSATASPVPEIASPSQPPSVSADIRSSLPTHLWAALEQRWSEGQEAEDHRGVLLSVDDEMVSPERDHNGLLISKPIQRSVNLTSHFTSHFSHYLSFMTVLLLLALDHLCAGPPPLHGPAGADVVQGLRAQGGAFRTTRWGCCCCCRWGENNARLGRVPAEGSQGR